jgi:hypothetical protein
LCRVECRVRGIRGSEISGHECAAGEHGDVQGREKVRTNGQRVAIDIGFWRRAVEMKAIAGHASAQERILGIAGVEHAGQRGEALPQIAVKLQGLQVFVSGDGGIDAEEQDVACVESGVQIVSISQSADKQSRADEHDNRERGVASRCSTCPRDRALIWPHLDPTLGSDLKEKLHWLYTRFSTLFVESGKRAAPRPLLN